MSIPLGYDNLVNPWYLSREVVKDYSCVCPWECLWKRQTSIWICNWVKKVPSSMKVSIIQSIEGLDRTKVEEGYICFLSLSWYIHLFLSLDTRAPSSGALGFILRLTPSTSLVLRSSDLDWSMPVSFLVLQLVDSILWDFLICIIIWTNT